jgi:NADPH-dependent curcumin reductase CurA
VQEIQLKARPAGAPKESDFALVGWTAPELTFGDIMVEVDCFFS